MPNDESDEQQDLSLSISSTSSSLISSPLTLSSQSSVSAAPSVSSYKGQPLLGAWASNGLSGADVLKKLATPTLLSSNDGKSDNLKKNIERGRSTSFPKERTYQQPYSYYKKQQSNDSLTGRRSGQRERVVGGEPDYSRSVSDNSAFANRQKQTKKRSTHHSSEPAGGGRVQTNKKTSHM